MPKTVIDRRLQGTARAAVVQEFFTNSGHFPLALVFFELLTDGWVSYLAKPDPYFTLGAGMVQAVALGRAQHRGKPLPLPGNLIAPAIYTAFELLLEGWEFFEQPHHLAYWGIALIIGLMQWTQLRAPRRIAALSMLIENITRTSIVLVMYWAFESLTHPDTDRLLAAFLEDDSHRFMAVVIPLLGIFVGVAQINADRYLRLLRETAAQLRTYSEWFFGRDLLSSAVANPDVLVLQRRQRAVVFIDIRGFTQWSEDRPPEDVVGMVNTYFEAAERVWSAHQPIKVKLTADEVMLIFADSQMAARVAIDLVATTCDMLARLGLAAGGSVHAGPLVEGLLGSEGVRGYDVIGDTVNTAKRLCEAAQGREVLLSEAVYDSLDAPPPIHSRRSIRVKGKAQPLDAYVVCPDEIAAHA